MNTEFTKEELELAREIGRLAYEAIGIWTDEDVSAMVIFDRMSSGDGALEQLCRNRFPDYKPFSKTVEEQWKMIRYDNERKLNEGK